MTTHYGTDDGAGSLHSGERPVCAHPDCGQRREARREQDAGTDILALALAALTGALNGNDDTRDFAQRCICILKDADLDRLREAFGWLDAECCEELSRRHS